MSAFGDALARGVVEIEIDDSDLKKQLTGTEATCARGGDRAAKAFKAGFERNKLDPESLGLNAQQIERRAEMAGQRAGRSFGAGFRKGGGGGGMDGQGLMQIGYALDDMQYGMQGVLNNVPGIVSAFGASGPVAAALSIFAVAAYQAYTHWDKLMAAIGATDPVKGAMAGLGGEVDLLGEALETAAQKIDILRKKKQAGGLSHDEEIDLAQTQTMYGIRKKQFDDQKLLNATATSTEQAKRGGAFRAGVGELSGGSKSLVDALVAGGMNKVNAESMVGAALRGDKAAGENVRNRAPRGGEFDKFRQKAYDPDRDARRKRMDAKLEQDTNEGVRQLEQEEAFKAAEERKAIEAKFKAQAAEVVGRQTVLEAKRDIQQEKADGINQSQTFSGARSYVGAAQTSAMNQIPKQQLDAIKETNKLIAQSNTELANIRMARDKAMARFAE